MKVNYFFIGPKYRETQYTFDKFIKLCTQPSKFSIARISSKIKFGAAHSGNLLLFYCLQNFLETELKKMKDIL